MAQITLKGDVFHTLGTLPAKNTKAPDFRLTKNDLSTVSLDDFKGKQLVLNIFPSVDTSTCAASVIKFNKKAAGLPNTKVLCISKDLPFAQARFCGAENIEDVMTLSGFKTEDFGKEYQLTIVDGPLEGLYSRAIMVIDTTGKIRYSEQVAEIIDEPNYEAVLEALNE